MSIHLPRLRLEYLLILVFLFTAGCAVGLLTWIRARHAEAARIEATRSVLADGEALVGRLAEVGQRALADTGTFPAATVSTTLESMAAAHPALETLSISRDNALLHHYQATTQPPPPAESITISRELLVKDNAEVPVIVFSRRIPTPSGEGRVEAVLRLNAVSAEAAVAARLVDSLYLLAVGIVVLAMSLCVAVLLRALIHDRALQVRARREEHLTFSGVLANGILHDFRNPMSSVRLDVQMLAREARRPEGVRPERMETLALRIAATMERMDQIFKEFLTLARPAEEAATTVDPAALLAACADTLAPRMEQAGVRFELLRPAEPLYIQAQPIALQRALLNILVNAVQFSPRDSVVTAELTHDRHRTLLEIRDRGPGIPEADRERVFNMFVSTRPGGTGLGLFLARTTLERIGAAIAALPHEGGGTRIRITFGATRQG